MKYAWLYAIGTIACTASLWAQTSTQQRSAPGSEATPARRFVAIGCISREAAGSTAANRGSAAGARFIITDTRGGRGHEAAYRLDGDQKLLEIHVGHTLEIAGTISSAGATALPVLKVDSLTYISTSCQKP
jgi:hypothetical protein